MSDQNDRKTNVEPAPAPEERAGRISKLVNILAAGLGIGGSAATAFAVSTGDAGTMLAHERTDLALARTYLAAERTLMGWIRTALSMIGFGFTLGKLSVGAGEGELLGLMGFHSWSVASLAPLLVVLGTVALLAAVLQFSRRAYELTALGLPRRPSIEFAVAIVLVVLGGFAFTALVGDL